MCVRASMLLFVFIFEANLKKKFISNPTDQLKCVFFGAFFFFFFFFATVEPISVSKVFRSV